MKKMFSVLLLACFATAGCGSGASHRAVPDHRPTVDELIPAVNKLNPTAPDPVLACQARSLDSSVLSDAALWSLVSDTEYAMPKDEVALLAEGGQVWIALKGCEANK